MKKEIEQLKDNPLITGAKAKVNIVSSYNDSLAQAYAVEGWRYYIEQLLNLLVRDAALSSKDWEDYQFKRGKIVGLNELLARSKTSYEQYNKLQKLTLAEQHEKSIPSQEIDEQGENVESK